MSEVPKRVVCVRLAMSESLSRSRRPTAEGRWLHRAGVARRRAGSCRRIAFSHVTRDDDAPWDQTAGPSSGCLGGGMARDTPGADGRCPRSLRGLAMGLVTLSALVVAVPTEAQTMTVPGAPARVSAYPGDGRVRLNWSGTTDTGGVVASKQGPSTNCPPARFAPSPPPRQFPNSRRHRRNAESPDCRRQWG